jgi:hypothetical protein
MRELRLSRLRLLVSFHVDLVDEIRIIGDA